MTLLARWLADESGQDIVEYVLLGSLIGFAGLLVMNLLANPENGIMKTVYASWDEGTKSLWVPDDPL